MAPMSAPTVPLHRVQFLPPVPSPIVALAYPPQPLPPARDPSAKGKAPARRQERPEFPLLVVARENGEVELWAYGQGESARAKGNWVLSKVLPPTLTHPSISLMALVLRDPANFHRKAYFVPRLEDLRLFTAGSDSSDLVERCLHTGRILNVHPVPSPPLWSMSVSPTHSLLCLATSSPNLHFLSIPPFSTDHPALGPPPPELLRSDNLPARCRTVSIAWGPPELREVDGEWIWRDSYLVTGHSDSSFRKFELPGPSSGAGGRGAGRVLIKGRGVVEKVRLAGKQGKKSVGKGTIVWGVAVLPDHTIVTSDSLGVLSFWDPKSFAQIDTFPAHKADIMTLAVSFSGETVFTSGPDQRIAQFARVSGRWRMLANRRVHSHDVRALSVFPPYTPHTLPSPTDAEGEVPAVSSQPYPVNPGWAPVLVSGGWDMSPHFTCASAPLLSASGSDRNSLGKRVVHLDSASGQDAAGAELTNFAETFIRNSAAFAAGRAQVAGKAGLVLWRGERGVSVWRVERGTRSTGETGWEKVLEMEFKLRTNLVASAISPSGRLLAVSDLYETKLFRLSRDSGSSAPHSLRARRIKTFLPVLAASAQLSHLEVSVQGCGASALHFAESEGEAGGARLVLGLVWSGEVVLCDLKDADAEDEEENQGEEEEVRVVGCFRPDNGNVGTAGRAVKGKKRAGQVNGTAHHKKTPNGHHATTVPDAEDENDDVTSESDSESDSSSTSNPSARPSHLRTPVSCSSWPHFLASSPDSQFLALSSSSPSSGGHVFVFSLDTLSLYSALPTLPCAPIGLSFLPPGAGPGLLIALPTGQLQLFNLDSRRLMPIMRGSELDEVNTVLEGSFTPALGMEVAPASLSAPPRHASANGHAPAARAAEAVRVVVWSHDYLATVRLSPSALLAPSSASASTHGLNGTGAGGSGSGSGARSRSASTTGSARKRRAREAEIEANEARRLVSQSHSRSPSVSLSTGVGQGQRSGLAGAGHGTSRCVRVEREKFRGVLGAGWFSPVEAMRDGEGGSGQGNEAEEEREGEEEERHGEPEMVVFERPYDSYRSALPPSFSQGLYGRT